MTNPSQEDILWALEWALGNLSQEPPANNFAGWTPIQMNEWKADRIEASEILHQAQKADSATASEKQVDENLEPTTTTSQCSASCPICGDRHSEDDCFWRDAPLYEVAT